MFDVAYISIFDVVCKRFDVEYKFKISRPKYLFLWCLFLTKKWVQNGVYRNVFFFTMGLIESVPGRSILYYFVWVLHSKRVV